MTSNTTTSPRKNWFPSLPASPSSSTLSSFEDGEFVLGDDHGEHYYRRAGGTGALTWWRLPRVARTTIMMVVLVAMPMFLVYWQEEPMVTYKGIQEKSKQNSTTSTTSTTTAAAAVLSSEPSPSQQHEEEEEASSLATDVQSNLDEIMKQASQNRTDDIIPTAEKEIGDNNSNNSSNLPSMVWLMSFPNSGTSYTMRMVATASNRAIATNYGAEATTSPYPNTPLYHHNDSSSSSNNFEGPFWDPQGNKPLPSEYILTKTHCGGRCGRCRPSRYVLTPEQFTRACAQGMGCQATANDTDASTKKKCQWTEFEYAPPPRNPNLGKLIHLIRNPFDNLVSRYHLAMKNAKSRLKGAELEAWLKKYPNNASGFDMWCRDLDRHYGSPLVARGNTTLTCQGEWFKYTQWHSLAMETVRQSGLPTLTIFYEDYENDWNATVGKILNFLKVDEISDEIREFVSGKHYDDHYTERQRSEAKSLVKQVASPQAWELLQRYF